MIDAVMAFLSAPLDLYCERTDPTYWAEPVNAISNAAFLIAALAAFMHWRRSGGRDPPVLALIVVVVLVGLGSFAFHTWATRGAMLLDVVPIGIFIYGYFLLALRRILKLAWFPAILLFTAFIALSLSLARFVPRDVLNGASGYLPALAALFAIGWLARTQYAGRALLLAGAIFIASLASRIADLAVCGAIPLGTHFVWHVLNAAVLYVVLRAVLANRAGAAQEPP